MSKKKFYVQNHGGPDYLISDTEDIYGSCHDCKTFREAKEKCISFIKNDIDQLKYRLSVIRKLKKSDVVTK